MEQREFYRAPPRLKVLVLNNSDDMLELVAGHLEKRGCLVTTAHIGPIRHGDSDGARLVEAMDPDVVVFDVSAPFEANWKVAVDLQTDARVRAPFVFSTTNRGAFYNFIGRNAVIELIGTPVDLDDLYNDVVRASRRYARSADQSDDHRHGERRANNDRRHTDRRTGPEITIETASEISRENWE
jgi:DNA-binding response OmpR family regulator